MGNQNSIHVLSRAVVIYEGKILLCRNVQRKEKFYFLPGGHVEHKESVRDALVREMKEETGEDFFITRFLGCLEYSFDQPAKKTCHDHEYNFVFEMKPKELKPHQTMVCIEDHIELTWEPIEQLENLPLLPEPLKKLIPLWIEEKNVKVFMSEMK